MTVAFNYTHENLVDRLLDAVEVVSKSFHNTERWEDEAHGSGVGSYADWVSDVAKDVADEIQSLRTQLAEAEAKGRNAGLEEAAKIMDIRAYNLRRAADHPDLTISFNLAAGRVDDLTQTVRSLITNTQA